MGPDASLFAGGDLCIGCAGDGTLVIEDGGSATSFTAGIGDLPGSTGLVQVSGSDSIWDIPFFLSVGNATPLGPEGPVARLRVEDDGTVNVGPGGILVLQNGEILGDGTISGDVVSIGAVRPGLSAGTLTISGEYEQVGQIPGFGQDSGRLMLQVGGIEPGSYDQLVVEGPVTLGGGLFVELIEGFESPGELDLPLLVAPSRTDDKRFDVGFFPGIPGGRFLTVTYAGRGAGDVFLVTKPLSGGIDLEDPENVALTGAANSVAVGDFDLDGLDDLVVTVPEVEGAGSAVVLLTRFEGGQYAPTAATYTMGIEPCALAVGDFDGLPGLDIAVANAQSNDVRVLTNTDGTGIFNPVTPETTFPVGNEPRGITTADFDLDGFLDLAVANALDGTVEILLGSELPLFESWTDLLYTGDEPIVFAVDPFDPDDDDDYEIAVANRDGTVSVFVNRFGATGELAFDDAIRVIVGQNPVQLAQVQ